MSYIFSGEKSLKIFNSLYLFQFSMYYQKWFSIMYFIRSTVYAMFHWASFICLNSNNCENIIVFFWPDDLLLDSTMVRDKIKVKKCVFLNDKLFIWYFVALFNLFADIIYELWEKCNVSLANKKGQWLLKGYRKNTIFIQNLMCVAILLTIHPCNTDIRIFWSLPERIHLIVFTKKKITAFMTSKSLSEFSIPSLLTKLDTILCSTNIQVRSITYTTIVGTLSIWWVLWG